MSHVTICMPSNRPLAQSRPSIDSAISYAIARNCRLIIADNSGDPAKKAHFAAGPACLRMIDSLGASALENLLISLEAADTGFVMPMGDDDFLHRLQGRDAFDFSSLPSDCVGVRPILSIFSAEEKEILSLNYSIDGATAADRFVEYNKKRGGANSVYYAFFRRQSFVPILRSYYKGRQTVLGDFDWAVSSSLMFEGRVALDPSTLYRYDVGRWRHVEGVQQTVNEFYRGAGLDASAAKFDAMFKFMDIYVTTFRPGLGGLSEIDRLKALYTAAIALLGGFVQNATRDRERFRGDEEKVMRLAKALGEPNQDLLNVFEVCAAIADGMKPGFGQEMFAWRDAVRRGDYG